MKSLARRLRARVSTQLQPSDQSNLEDAQAHQEMLTNFSGASEGGRVATPIKAAQNLSISTVSSSVTPQDFIKCCLQY